MEELAREMSSLAQD
jgi:hypothetical protein